LLQATLSFIGETAAGYFATGTVPNRIARVKNSHAFAFVARDNLPLAIHCSVPEKFWLGLLKAADRMEIAEDARFKTRDDRRRNFEQLEKELALTFATKDREQWLRLLEENDVPASPLYDMKEVLEDPQVLHLAVTEEVEHPKTGKAKFVGGPVRYEGLCVEKPGPPPLPGEHTDTILAELGYSRADIDKLSKTGAVQLQSKT
jgi:crotonobetainyl-CoA:carnitine CoA-transferase CaiB-like acyl-CoA transferase